MKSDKLNEMIDAAEKVNPMNMTNDQKKKALDGAGLLTTGGAALALTGFVIPLGALAIPIAAVAGAVGLVGSHIVGKKVFND